MSINTVMIGFGKGFNPMQYHYNAIKSTKGLNFYGCCEIDADRKNEAKKQFNIKMYDCFDEVISDPEVDLVVITTPNNTHAEMSIKALNSGKHVVTEKIMALTTKEADLMIEAAKLNNCMLSVRQNRRWDSDFLTVKDIIEKNILGEVFVIDSSINMYIKPGGWRSQKELGGGFLNDWGAHLFDQIVQLVKSEPDTVFADLEYKVWNVGVDTHSRVITKFKNGLIVEVETSNISWITRPRWHVRGDKGALIYMAGKAKIKNVNGEYEYPTIAGNYKEFYQNISDVLNEGSELIVKPQEVRTSIAIIEAAHISAEKGESVKV